jgi:NTP pyrophosphatase (non-canonical NTP hydrolase)
MSDVIRALAALLTERDGLDPSDRYTEMLRVAKVGEEYGELMQAVIAYHGTNPRKPTGPLKNVITELCDVALSAKIALESFGCDSEFELAHRAREILERLEPPACGAPEPLTARRTEAASGCRLKTGHDGPHACNGRFWLTGALS